MYLISAGGYENAKLTNEIWVSLKDVGSDIDVKNISDLTLFRMGSGVGWGVCQKGPPIRFSCLTSANVGINPPKLSEI